MTDVSANGLVAGDITPTEVRRWALLEDDEEIRVPMAKDVMEEVEESFASGVIKGRRTESKVLWGRKPQFLSHHLFSFRPCLNMLRP